MNEQTIFEIAFELLREMDAAKEQMQGVNDYGEVTGLCDEHDLLQQDARAVLSGLRTRANRLKRRAMTHKEQKKAKP